MTVTYKEYQKEKLGFFEQHNYSYQIDTSSMNEYGVYTKFYNFEDGAQWYERMSPAYRTTEVEVEKVLIKVEVKLFETEYWSSQSASKLFYEKF